MDDDEIEDKICIMCNGIMPWIYISRKDDRFCTECYEKWGGVGIYKRSKIVKIEFGEIDFDKKED